MLLDQGFCSAVTLGQMLDSLWMLNCLDLLYEDSESNAKEVFLLHALGIEPTHDELHHLFLKLRHDIASPFNRWTKVALFISLTILSEKLSSNLTYDEVFFSPADLPCKHFSSLIQPAHFIIL